MEVLVHSIADACAVARVGKTAIYEAINSGKLPARKRGRRTLILAEDLRRYLNALPPLVPPKASAEAFKPCSTEQRDGGHDDAAQGNGRAQNDRRVGRS
jgi:excisionase family DNA binding protein